MINRERPANLLGSDGSVLISILGFIMVLAIIAVGLMTVITINISIVSQNVQRAQALNIAESGVNYYLWHMAHNGQDYKDGQTTPATPDPSLGYGPYVHDYSADNINGTFTLWIKPAGVGSTVFTVTSIGQIDGSDDIRTVQAQIGAKSFASYGIASDQAVYIGNTSIVQGPIFSNQGIRMDGSGNDSVGSAKASYVPPYQFGGDGGSHPGVWCSSSVTTPVNCNTRDKSNWHYPEPALDFNSVTSSLCSLKEVALEESSYTVGANACSDTSFSSSNYYLKKTATSWSPTKGYLIVLNSDGTYNISKVNGENDRSYTTGSWGNRVIHYIHSYTDALSLQPIASDVSLPSDGVIYAEDNVWVLTNPDFHGRVTIAAGRLGSSYYKADINIAGNLKYSTRSGQDSIGLVAEDNVMIKPYAPPDPSTPTINFEIDAAIIAEDGFVGWPTYYQESGYQNTCPWGFTGSNQQFTFYGSEVSRQGGGWATSWGGDCGDANYIGSGTYVSGFRYRNDLYDYNLLYAPPPSYPVTGSYQILSWREVLTSP